MLSARQVEISFCQQMRTRYSGDQETRKAHMATRDYLCKRCLLYILRHLFTRGWICVFTGFSKLYRKYFFLSAYVATSTL